MKTLPRGHIRYKGKIYVRAICAGRMLGVFSSSITNMFNGGKIPGVLLPARYGFRKVLFVLKSAVTPKLYQLRCAVCEKRFRAPTVRRNRTRTFCSMRCADKWWNYHAPVRGGVRTKRKP